MTFCRPTTRDDVDFIAYKMREGDIEECMAGGFTPYEALSRSFEDSIVTYTLHTPNGVPAALTGVAPSRIGSAFGAIWMLGTDDISKHRIYALRRCKPFVANLYDELGMECFYNYTFASNTLHHNWLKWLGFTFLRKVQMPPYGQEFYEFVRLKG